MFKTRTAVISWLSWIQRTKSRKTAVSYHWLKLVTLLGILSSQSQFLEIPPGPQIPIPSIHLVTGTTLSPQELHQT